MNGKETNTNLKLRERAPSIPLIPSTNRFTSLLQPFVYQLREADWGMLMYSTEDPHILPNLGSQDKRNDLQTYFNSPPVKSYSLLSLSTLETNGDTILL